MAVGCKKDPKGNDSKTGRQGQTGGEYVTQCNKAHDDWQACVEKINFPAAATTGQSLGQAITELGKCQDIYKEGLSKLEHTLTEEQKKSKETALEEFTDQEKVGQWVSANVDLLECQSKTTEQEKNLCAVKKLITTFKEKICSAP